ncbi:PH domain-containing protein [Chloroflexota bacterium]
MKYSKSIMLYQDEPPFGLFLKLIITIVPVAMLAGSIYSFSTDDNLGGIALLVEAFVVGLIFWCVFPRKYQVYEDHVRIVLGGPFSVKIGFDEIAAIRISSKLNLTVNFITRLAKNGVEISKKKGMSFAITPGDYDRFIENANQALDNWIKTNSLD